MSAFSDRHKSQSLCPGLYSVHCLSMLHLMFGSHISPSAFMFRPLSQMNFDKAVSDFLYSFLNEVLCLAHLVLNSVIVCPT